MCIYDRDTGGWFGFEKEKETDYRGQWDRIYAWQITRIVNLLVQYPHISLSCNQIPTPPTTLPVLPIPVPI
jgi:hypothetical protein